MLMPLLGTTWVLGLLSVNSDTVVFQYLFAIVNSLQVSSASDACTQIIMVIYETIFLGAASLSLQQNCSFDYPCLILAELYEYV